MKDLDEIAASQAGTGRKTPKSQAQTARHILSELEFMLTLVDIDEHASLVDAIQKVRAETIELINKIDENAAKLKIV